MKVENSILSQQFKHYEALRAAKEEQINFSIAKNITSKINFSQFEPLP